MPHIIITAPKLIKQKVDSNMPYYHAPKIKKKRSSLQFMIQISKSIYWNEHSEDEYVITRIIKGDYVENMLQAYNNKTETNLAVFKDAFDLSSSILCGKSFSSHKGRKGSNLIVNYSGVSRVNFYFIRLTKRSNRT